MSQFNPKATAAEVAEVLADQISGKNVLITGVSMGGLGFEAVQVIVKYAALVTITGRTQAKLDEVKKQILAQHPKAQLRTLILDLASFANVRKAAAEFNAYPERTHVLINNAGTFPAAYEKSADGIELQLQVNVLGPFLFTALIYPRIVADATAESPLRIVKVASGAHNFSPFLFEQFNSASSTPETYDKWTTYRSTKTGCLLFSKGLTERVKAKKSPVLVYAINPGFAETNMLAEITEKEWTATGMKTDKGEWTFVHPKPLPEAAAAYIVAAFDPKLAAANGAYISDLVITEPAPHATDDESVEKLWKLSEEKVGQKFEL